MEMKCTDKIRVTEKKKFNLVLLLASVMTFVLSFFGAVYKAAPMRCAYASADYIADDGAKLYAARGITKTENGYTAAVWNRYNTEKSAMAIWVAYGQEGELLEVITEDVNITPSDDENTVYFRTSDDFSVSSSREKIKFFLWEHENALTPLISSLSYPSEQKEKELSILPGTDEYYENFTEQTDDGYSFIYCGNSETIEYKYSPEKGGFNDIKVSVNGGEEKTAAADGFTFTEDSFLSNRNVEFDGKRVVVDEIYTMADGAQIEHIRYSIWISGKTLVTEISADNGAVTKYSHTVEMSEEIPVPYLPGFINIGINDGKFVSLYADWTYGNSSAMAKDGITYNKNIDNIRCPFKERLMLTVSKTINDVFPTIPNTASKYRSTMADRMVLDWWGHTQKRKQFDYMSDYTDYLYDYGLRDVVFIRHIWQNNGYDTKIPESYPANESYGGDAELIPFGEKMKNYGWIFALHTNYTDYSPYYDEYNEAHAIKNSDGTIRGGGRLGEGEYNILNKFIKSGYYNYYINKHEPEIKKRYLTSGSFVDVFAARSHSRDVDYDATASGAAMHRTVYNDTASAIETTSKEIPFPVQNPA